MLTSYLGYLIVSCNHDKNDEEAGHKKEYSEDLEDESLCYALVTMEQEVKTICSS
jgi:disulfide oxidoreductase YuzD